MLLTVAPWCQVAGIKSYWRRPARRKMLRWIPVLEPMEIRTVLSPVNLAVQFLEVATPKIAEVASTNAGANSAANAHSGLSIGLELKQAVTVLQDLNHGNGQKSVAASEVSLNPPAVVISLYQIGNGHNLESHAVFSHGQAAMHVDFVVVNIEPLVTWSISFSTSSGRGIGNALIAQSVTVFRFGSVGFETDIAATSSFAQAAQSDERVTTSTFALANQSRLATASSTGAFAAVSPAQFLVPEQMTASPANISVTDRKIDKVDVVVDKIAMDRFLDNLNPNRPNRLIYGTVGDLDGRAVLMLETPTVRGILPELTTQVLPGWDAELSLPTRITKPESQVKPDQPNPSDENSPDAKKTKNENATDKKNRNGKPQGKQNQTDGQKETGTEVEGNSTTPSMSSNKRSRSKTMRASSANRPSSEGETTMTQGRASDEMLSRPWLESFLDPATWLTGIMSLAPLAAVLQANRKREDTDV